MRWNMFKLVVAGGREFNDYALLEQELNYILKDYQPEEIEIVSGGARGADRLGEKFALENEYKLTRFPADWERWGNSAGYRRNSEMSKYSDGCIAFWDQRSKGTKHMIDLATKEGILLKVVKYERG